MSLGYSVFVFTDEGDCMVTETFGCIQLIGQCINKYKNICMISPGVIR